MDPSTLNRRDVLALIENQFAIPAGTIVGAEKLSDFGADSLDLTSLLITTEDDLNVSIDASEMSAHVTVDEFVSAVEKARTA